MKSEYTEDELLPLSGIQHFFFCRRQWALIHVEQQWEDNILTVEGKQMHQTADDPFFTEIRDGIVITRSMPVASYRLGLFGICDVVEYSPHSDGILLKGRQGKFMPAPVEYKRGKEKADVCDEAHLCAQAMCLEEMLAVQINEGCLFYGQTRQRVRVEFSPELRNAVEKACAEMHAYLERGFTPQVKPSRACQSCSLVNACMPNLKKFHPSAAGYIQAHLDNL